MSGESDTKPCLACGESMPPRRGVCSACGHATTWFKLRFYVGCGSILFATLGWLLLWLLAMRGP